MTEETKKKQSDEGQIVKRIFKGLCFFCAVLLLFVPATYYFVVFGLDASLWGWAKHSQWAEMGTYFSGMYAPILSLFTAIFLFMQIQIMKKQTNIQGKQTDIQKKQNDIQNKQLIIEETQLLLGVNDIKTLIKHSHSFFISAAGFFEYSRAFIERGLRLDNSASQLTFHWYNLALEQKEKLDLHRAALISDLRVIEDLQPDHAEQLTEFRRILTEVSHEIFNHFDALNQLKELGENRYKTIILKPKENNDIELTYYNFLRASDIKEHAHEAPSKSIYGYRIVHQEMNQSEFNFLSSLQKSINDDNGELSLRYKIINQNKDLKDIEEDLLNIITNTLTLPQFKKVA